MLDAPTDLPLHETQKGHRAAASCAPSRLRSILRALVPALILVVASVSTSDAVIIDTGDGTGNTTPPAADPGFDHVGVVNGLSGVYVRNGWVLTASHVGEAPILLNGVSYAPVVGSRVRFQNADLTFADLIAFKLAERPPLPDLLITNGPISNNTLITVIGNGRNRGAQTSWNGVDGWAWGSGTSIRWGTNRVGLTGQRSLDTDSFWTYFDEFPTGGPGQHEADIVTGDSGGAAFVGSGPSAELVGILFARAGFMNQPAGTSLYGDAGLIADLYAYRSSILAVIDQPDCDDGLDDDGDGLADYPADPGCSSPTDTSEREASLACDNEIDDDGDGTIDLGDGGCSWPGDTSERGAAAQCDNGLDDDGDTLSDFPADPGCLHPTNPIEAPEPGFALPLLLGTATLAGARQCRPGRLTCSD